MARLSAQAAEAKVAEHKSGGFSSTAHQKSFQATYSGGAIAQVRGDFQTIYGGVRMASYTASSMTTQEKKDTGVMNSAGELRINADIWVGYKHANTYLVHEGMDGSFIMIEGTLFHIPDETDFENFQKGLERFIAYQYVVEHGTETEGDNALLDYTAFKATIT